MSTNAMMSAEPTAYTPMPDEMILDTNSFDIFSSLDDVVVEDVNPQGKSTNDDAAMPANNAAEDGTESMPDIPEESDDYEDYDFDAFDFENDEDEQEESEEADEEAEEDTDEAEESEEDEGEVEYDEEDLEQEVEYDSYEVTLPNGETVVLQEAIEGYRNAKALEEEKQSFEDAKSRFQEEAGNTYKYLKLARLEADRVIGDYKDFNWAELARNDPQAYVENKEFLEKYTIRRKEIADAMVEMDQKEEANTKAEFQNKAQTCVQTLKADIPGWNESVYQDLMAYAVQNGAPEEEITKCVDPVIFKMLHKARQFDQGKEVAKARVKRKISSPKKVARSAPKSHKQPDNKAKLIKKMDAGFGTDSDVFAALED